MATPLALVNAVVVGRSVSVNQPSGAVNVTGSCAPTEFPSASLTLTLNELANCELMDVLCGVPPATEIGAGTNVFARLKRAVDCEDPTDAITL